MEILKHAHSGLRWLVLIGLIYAIFNALSKANKAYTEKDRKLNLMAMMFVHIQLLLGLILYFISDLVQFSSGTMKNSVLRFYTVEHIFLMLVAIVLITIGHSKSKKATEDAKKFKTILIFYSIGLILILAGIPWPFRNLGAGWF